jgi:hypothetical protein
MRLRKRPGWIQPAATLLATAIPLFGCENNGIRPPINPVISALAADPVIVKPGESSTITVAATDPYGDPVGYLWSAAEGFIHGTGESVVWTAPETEGTYPILVTVLDDEGGSATDTVRVDVFDGTLLIQTRDGLTAVRLDGGRFVLYPYSSSVEVLGDRIFLKQWGGIAEIGHDGRILATSRPADPGAGGHTFTILPDGGWAALNNVVDSVFILAPDGSPRARIPIPNRSSGWQNLDGVVVGDRLIVSENGNDQVFQIDLSTHEASIFRSTSSQPGHLGAIEHDGSGTFFLARYVNSQQRIDQFTEGGVLRPLTILPHGNITGIVSVGSHLFAVVNHEGALYRINRFTGEFEKIFGNLDYPQDIEYLPVPLEEPSPS